MKPLGETSLILLSVVLPLCRSLNYYTSILSSYINTGTSSVLRTSVQPFSSFLRASVLSPAAASLASVQPQTFVRFLTFFHWLLSLLYLSHFAVTYFSYLAVTFSLHKLMRYLSVLHFSYLMNPLGETLTLLSAVLPLCRSLNYYTSILFVLYKCWNFFSVSRFGGAILFFFCALQCCLLLLQLCLQFNHVRPLAFSPFLLVFVFFTLRCHLFFILRCHLFFFINSCAFSYCLSFLLPEEACGRNVVNSTVCCSTVCCSLNYYTSILFVLHNCRNFFCVANFRAAILVFSTLFRAASCCCNFAFCSTPTFVRFLTFLYWLLSLLYFSHFAVTYFSYFAVTFFAS